MPIALKEYRYQQHVVKGLKILKQRFQLTEDIKFEGNSPYLETKDFCICGDGGMLTKNWHIETYEDGRYVPEVAVLPTLINLIDYMKNSMKIQSKGDPGRTMRENLRFCISQCKCWHLANHKKRFMEIENILSKVLSSLEKGENLDSIIREE